MVETLAYTYTSHAEIERLMSVDGIDNMEDDAASTPGTGQVDLEDLETEFIAEATDEVNFRVQGYYAPEDIYNNMWVRRRATWIAAYLLTRRRANPGYYDGRYEQAIKELDQIANNDRKIPRAPERAVSIPSISNYVVDDRYPFNQLRVEPWSMVGQADSRQHPWTIFPYDSLF